MDSLKRMDAHGLLLKIAWSSPFLTHMHYFQFLNFPKSIERYRKEHNHDTSQNYAKLMKHDETQSHKHLQKPPMSRTKPGTDPCRPKAAAQVAVKH
jgi:hypothetical protein